MAVDAGRVLKDRDRGSEITVINDDTRQWVIMDCAPKRNRYCNYGEDGAPIAQST
jgi:hypothetical protein